MRREQAPKRRDLVGAVEAWAQGAPDVPALYLGRQVITFKQLDARANRVANALKGLGIQKNDRVAIMLPNIAEFVYTFIGTLKIGAVAVPFNPLYKGKEMLHILGDSGATALFALADVGPMINEILPQLPQLGHVVLIGA